MTAGPRIAFTTTVYDHTEVGGGTFVYYLREAVEDGRLDVTFFSDDIRTVTTNYERRVGIPSRFRRLPGGWLPRSYYFHKAVQSEHRKRPFDVIWHNNVITSLVDLKQGVGVPIVGMINDYNNAESNTPLATRTKFGGHRAFVRYGWHQFEKYAARRVDHLVVNSNYMADSIRSAYGVEANRIRLLYKGVDLDQFAFAGPKALADPIRVLFVKQDFVRGGLWDLLRAIADFPVDVRLTVVGPPSQVHTSISQAAEEAGVARKIEVLAGVDRTRIYGLFRSHDVLCIPSRAEALGVAYMEALACGLPVVATNVGGIPEVLDYGRAGWLADAGDPESIREALLDVIHNETARKEKIAHGREHVAAFSHENMIKAMRAIALSILKPRNSMACI